jgi:nucleoside-diphosphate-sugar epimerase
MSIRVVGGRGTVTKEVLRLLSFGGGATPPGERVLLETDDPATARAGLRKARARYAARVVLISSLAADRSPQFPINRPAAEVRKLLEDSGLPFTVLLPNHLYQDDLAFRESIVQRGVYPLPIGPEGMSRVDAREVAQATVRALLDPGHDGQAYPIVGPEALSAKEVIEYYARALGRSVCAADDGGGEISDRYRPFQQCGLRARSEDFARMEVILGYPPRPFGMFVREAVQAWTSPRIC